MKKSISVKWAIVAVTLAVAASDGRGATGSDLPSTPYTRTLLRSSNSATARATLQLVDTNALVVLSNGVVFIRGETNQFAASGVYMPQPVGVFGSMMISGASGTTNTYVANNVYVMLTNFTTVRTNQFISIQGWGKGYLTNIYAGYYRINFYATLLPGNSDTIEMEIFLDETAREEVSVFNTFDVTARAKSVSASGVLYIPANTGISLRVNNRSANNDSIAIWRGGLTVGTP